MITKRGMLDALDGLITAVEELRVHFLDNLQPWTPQFVVWLKAAESTVETVFGSRSEAYLRFQAIHFQPPPEEQHANEIEAGKAKLLWFHSGLDFAKATLIGFRYSVERLATDDEPSRPSPYIFISHGGPTRSHVDAVRDFLSAVGLQPLIVADLPSLGMSVNSKVLGYMGICSAGIALATTEDETTSHERRARPNVENEIGMMQAINNIGERIIYLKEPEVQFASNYAEKVWIEFRKDRVHEAFTAIAKELRAFRLVGWDV